MGVEHFTNTVDIDALSEPVIKAGTASATGVFIAAFEAGDQGYFTLSATTTGAWQDAAGQAGLVAVEGSNDPGPGGGVAPTTGWSALRMENPNGQTTTAPRGGGTFHGQVTMRWMRVNCLVFKAGTYVANLIIFPRPRQLFKHWIGDQDGISRVEVTPGTSRLHTISPTPLLGGNFDQEIDSDVWTVTATGSGTAAIVSGQGLKLQTGTTPDSTIRIQSNRVADIVPGLANIVNYFAATEAKAGVGNVTRWGAYDDDSGVFLEQYHDGTVGQLRLRTRKAGVDSTVTLNGTNNVSDNGFGVAFYNLYEFQMDPAFVKFRQSSILGALASGQFPTLFSKFNLPLRMEIINTGGASTNKTLYVQYASTVRLGPPQTIRANESFEDDHVLAAMAAVIQGRRISTDSFDQIPLSEHLRDIGNEQVTPLGAAGVFEGVYRRISDIEHFEILYASLTPFTAVKVWSNDGINPLGGAFGTSVIAQTVTSGYNVAYDINEGRNMAPFYKLRITNGATPQSVYPGFINLIWLQKTPYQGSFGLLTAQLTNLSRALLVRSVQAGTQPDGDIVNAKASGLAFSLNEPHDAGEATASDFLDTDGWPSLQLFIRTDQIGEAELQFFDDIQDVRSIVDGVTTIGNPNLSSATAAFVVDDVGRALAGPGIFPGAKIAAFIDAANVTMSDDATDTLSGSAITIGPHIQHSRLYAYSQREVDVDFLSVRIPTELDGVRIVYRNNNFAGQSRFYLSANLYTTAVESPRASLGSTQEEVDEAVVGKSVIIAPNDAGDFESIGRDGEGASGNVHVTAIEDEVVVRPPQLGPSSAAFVLTPAEQRIDTPDITGGTGYREVRVVNSGDFHAFVREAPGVTEQNGIPLFLGGDGLWGLPPGTALYGICENTGGADTVNNRFGSTAGGIGSNPSNALTSNDTRSSQSATAQTIFTEGFTFAFGTGTAISKVELAHEGRKQSGQFETVSNGAFVQGTTTGSGSVTTTSLSAGTNSLLVAFIARNTSTATVTTLTGTGLTWTQLIANLTSGTRRLDVWYAYGNNSAGTITATLSVADRAEIVVRRYNNANPAILIQTSGNTSGSGTGVTGPGIAGTNKGMAILAIIHAENSGTAGAGYTEYADIDNGAIDLHVSDKSLVSTGTETGTATLGSSGTWAAVGLTIAPAPAIAPTTVLSYLHNGIPGATSSLITLSNTTDAIQTVDITTDRIWVPADIALVRALSTASTVGAAAIEADTLYLIVTETSGATTRVIVVQNGMQRGSQQVV